MKFDIKLDKNFEIKLSSHKIKVKIVPSNHPAFKPEDPTKAVMETIVDKLSSGWAIAGPKNVVIKDEDDNSSELVHGLYDSNAMTIYLRKEDTETMRLSSFIHEAMHALEHIYTFNMDHTMLNLVAEALTQILVDNHHIKEKRTKTKKRTK